MRVVRACNSAMNGISRAIVCLITQVNQWLLDVWKNRQLTENKSVQIQATV